MGSDIFGNLPDNRDRNGRWSDPDFQYELFRALFRVGEDEQSVLNIVRERVRKIWFERQHEPGRPRAYFDRGRNKGGSPYTNYNFKFPEEWWLANKERRRYRGEDFFPYFYRLDWLQKRWSIALKFFTEKAPKPQEEIRKMYRLSDILSPLLRRHSIETIPFVPKDEAHESIFLLIDPVTSPGLANLYDAHLEFVREATEQGLWHGA